LQTASSNLGQATSNSIGDANLQQAAQQAEAARLATITSINLISRQNAAQNAANFADLQLQSVQAETEADRLANEVKLLQEEIQRQKAAEAAQEAARARVAAVQAVINAQSALAEAGEKGVEAEMVFRGEFPGRCTGIGMYYNDLQSYYICDGIQHHLHRCPTGFRARNLNRYTLGKIYSANTFCNEGLQAAAVIERTKVAASAVNAEVGRRRDLAIATQGTPAGGQFVAGVELRAAEPFQARAGVFRGRAAGWRGRGFRGGFDEPALSAHSEVPHIHATGRGFGRRSPRAMTVTTQSHSQRHGGVTHTVQKHVRTVSDGKSYNAKLLSDHSLGGAVGGRGGRHDVNNGPVYHYHYYNKNGRVAHDGPLPGRGLHSHGHGPHDARFDGYDGPYGGAGPYNDDRYDGPGYSGFHGLLPGGRFK